MVMEVAESGKTRIKLFCPSMNKLIHVVAPHEQKLNLGSIAAAFGLDPSTVKLNGHFISRGLDFVASSVTWKSLIGFFSARGLSTGASDSDALLVDGKLSKIGSKRSYGVLDMSINGCSADNKRLHLNNEPSISGQMDSWSKTETRGCKDGELGLKRKWCLEDDDLCWVKRRKSALGCRERVCNGWTWKGILSCSSFYHETRER